MKLFMSGERCFGIECDEDMDGLAQDEEEGIWDRLRGKVRKVNDELWPVIQLSNFIKRLS